MVRLDNHFSEVSKSPHPHACIIYDDLTAYRRVASKYIIEGLNCSEKCIMAVDNYSQAMIEADFTDAEVDFASMVENGNLTIINVQKSYADNGGFDAMKTVQIWQRESSKAVSEGYEALRVVGEATFSIGKPELADKLIYYENIINRVLFPNYPFKSLCVYDKNLYNPQVIKAAISAHPILFYNDELYLENIHYVPPEIHFNADSDRNEIDMWLTNVKRNNDNLRLLRDSEHKFRSMFEKAPLSYQSLDEKGNFIEVNETWLKALGYGRHEVIGRNFSEFLHPDWKDHFKENFPRFKSVGEVLGVEFEMVKKNRELILVSFHGKIGKDENDFFKQTHCIFQDITTRKISDEALRKSEEKYRNVFENSVVGIFQSTPEGSFIEVNRALAKMMGYNSPQEFITEIIDMETQFYVEPDLRGKFLKIVAENGKIDDFEFEAKCKDGTTRWLSESSRAYFDDKGKTVRIEGIISDIHERKRVEKELRSSEAWHKSILQTAMDGFWLTDLEGKILEVNQAYCQMSGYSHEELLSMKIHDLDKLENKNAVSNRISQIIQNGEIRFESQHRCKDGSIIDVEVAVQYRETDGGKFVCFVRDITEKKNLSKRLQQAQKMESIGNLAGGIAHDFNNILFPIIGLAEMLTEDLPPNSPENENAREILTAGKRGSQLVQQILAFSCQHGHKQMPVRVQHVIKEVLKLSRSSIPMNIEISQDLQQDCGLVLADSTHLHQIGMNLITNAYHAVQDKGGKIHVEVREIEIKCGLNDPNLPPGKYVTLTVVDTGIGIAKDHLDKIFEPYFTTKEKGKGTGLGLSVVYGIVKEHKGEIKVQSEPGKGAWFQVSLPVMAAASDNIVPDRLPQPSGSGHILLVDDEPPITKLEKQILERLGYSVAIMTSSLDALEAFKARPNAYDLVISDMSMPHMTGDQLAGEILKIRPDIPIIICTGFSERLNKETAMALGIKGFLMKPVGKADIAREVQRVLDGYEPTIR